MEKIFVGNEKREGGTRAQVSGLCDLPKVLRMKYKQKVDEEKKVCRPITLLEQKKISLRSCQSRFFSAEAKQTSNIQFKSTHRKDSSCQIRHDVFVFFL